MARVSNKEGIDAVGGSQFDLILIVAHRGREYAKGDRPMISRKGGRGMTALREIEQGLIGPEYKDKIIQKYQAKTLTEENPS